MNYERILHAIEGGCNRTPELRERFGKSISYHLSKMVKMGLIYKEKGIFYKKS